MLSHSPCSVFWFIWSSCSGFLQNDDDVDGSPNGHASGAYSATPLLYRSLCMGGSAKTAAVVPRVADIHEPPIGVKSMEEYVVEDSHACGCTPCRYRYGVRGQHGLDWKQPPQLHSLLFPPKLWASSNEQEVGGAHVPTPCEGTIGGAEPSRAANSPWHASNITVWAGIGAIPSGDGRMQVWITPDARS
jgi:hypothetical protein